MPGAGFFCALSRIDDDDDDDDDRPNIIITGQAEDNGSQGAGMLESANLAKPKQPRPDPNPKPESETRIPNIIIFITANGLTNQPTNRPPD